MIDTTVLIDLERGASLDGLYAGQAASNQPRVSLVSIAELQVGIEHANTPQLRASRESFLQVVLQQFKLELATVQIAAEAGRVMHQLQSTGQRIGMHDSWIAATARVLGVPVLTANVGHFQRVQGLRVLEWSA